MWCQKRSKDLRHAYNKRSKSRVDLCDVRKARLHRQVQKEMRHRVSDTYDWGTLLHKLKMIVKKLIVKGLPEVEVHTTIVCVGCQFDKAHQSNPNFEIRSHWSKFTRMFLIWLDKHQLVAWSTLWPSSMISQDMYCGYILYERKI
jgi:hypothetical protein